MNQEDHRFDDLFRECADKVLRIAYSHVHDYDAAEDICQETFMRFQEHRDKIAPGAEKKWLLAVARNYAIDYLRKGGRYETKIGISGEAERSLNERTNVHTDLSDLMVLKEKRTALKRALENLARTKPDWYVALHLAEIEDMDNASIGKRMGVRADLVSKWKGRAKAWLREAYEKENRDC